MVKGTLEVAKPHSYTAPALTPPWTGVEGKGAAGLRTEPEQGIPEPEDETTPPAMGCSRSSSSSRCLHSPEVGVYHLPAPALGTVQSLWGLPQRGAFLGSLRPEQVGFPSHQLPLPPQIRSWRQGESELAHHPTNTVVVVRPEPRP